MAGLPGCGPDPASSDAAIGTSSTGAPQGSETQTPTASGGVQPTDCETVQITDPALEQYIRAELGLETDPLTAEALSALERVEFDTTASGSPFLQSLAGLECATNLEVLVWRPSSIEDFGPLAGLERLRILSLNGSASDLTPLSGIDSLRELRLGYFLYASDLGPLAALTDLEVLEMHDGTIADLAPLAGLTKLRVLSLYYNEIVDITPLAGLVALEELNLSGNAIERVDVVAGMTELRLVGLGANAIVDVSPLAGLEALEDVGVSHNEITDPSPLASLEGIRTLYLNVNGIQDLAGLAGATWTAPHGCADVNLAGNPLTVEAIETQYPQLCADHPNVAIWIDRFTPCNADATCVSCLPTDQNCSGGLDGRHHASKRTRADAEPPTIRLR